MVGIDSANRTNQRVDSETMRTRVRSRMILRKMWVSPIRVSINEGEGAILCNPWAKAIAGMETSSSPSAPLSKTQAGFVRTTLPVTE